MKVKTSYYFKAPPEKVWSLLLNSKMDADHPCFLLMGLPKPLSCSLEKEGVGNKRMCTSDKGVY